MSASQPIAMPTGEVTGLRGQRLDIDVGFLFILIDD